MPRSARVIVPGYAYHLVMRGNQRASVFFEDSDYRQYLLWLAEYSREYGMRVWAYCLMPNHVHLVVLPENASAPGNILRALQMRHTQRINQTKGSSGHLWQGRFYSCALDDEHLQAAVRYVERNPVRAQLADHAQDFMWSSARPHCGLRRDPVLSDDLPVLDRIPDWAHWLADDDDSRMMARLREATRRCRPCGSDDFVARLAAERQTGS